MARGTRQNHGKRAQARQPNRSQNQGKAVSRQPPPVSTYPSVGNAVPAPKAEELPRLASAAPENDNPGRRQKPVQGMAGRNDLTDCVQFRIKKSSDGLEKTYSLSGYNGVSKAICRLIPGCGVTAALIFVAIACVALHSSTLDKVICGLGGTGVGGLLWIGYRVRIWLDERPRKRRDKTVLPDIDQR